MPMAMIYGIVFLIEALIASILRVVFVKPRYTGDKEICFGVGVLCCFIWFV